jgi:hypothetical protein
MARAISNPSPFEESRTSRLGKRAVLWFILLQLPVGALSSYRAWVQIKSLTLSTTGPALAPGVVVRSDLVSWARTESDARIELVQRGRVAILGEVYLPRNREPVFDPRPQRGSVIVELTAEALAPFENGPATLRASALGRPQWLRTPPPTIREQVVMVARP